MRQQLARFRTHLIFGTVIAVWFLVGVLPNMIQGQSFMPALWTAIKEIRPVEWVVLFFVLFSLAFPRNDDKPRTTTLGLTGQKQG
jgi:hypothetical protein